VTKQSFIHPRGRIEQTQRRVSPSLAAKAAPRRRVPHRGASRDRARATGEKSTTRSRLNFTYAGPVYPGKQLRVVIIQVSSWPNTPAAATTAFRSNARDLPSSLYPPPLFPADFVNARHFIIAARGTGADGINLGGRLHQRQLALIPANKICSFRLYYRSRLIPAAGAI